MLLPLSRRNGSDSPSPGRSQVVETLGAGATFGVATLLNGRPRTVTARAITDVVLFALDRPAYRDLFAEIPAVG